MLILRIKKSLKFTKNFEARRSEDSGSESRNENAKTPRREDAEKMGKILILASSRHGDFALNFLITENAEKIFFDGGIRIFSPAPSLAGTVR